MAGYKDPGFSERIARAAAAKQAALEKLRAKPPVDEAVLEERRLARLAKEAAEAEKRAAKQAAKLAAIEEAKAAAEAAKLAVEQEAVKAVLTEAERKAARDARYAARKNRK